MAISSPSPTRRWLNAVLISGGILAGLQIIRWPLTNLITPFLEPFVEIAAGLAFLCVLVGTLVHALRHKKNPESSRWFPFAASLLFIATVYFVPFNAMYFKANFLLLRTRRTQVAERILAGPEGHRQNNGGRGNFLSLPVNEGYLSDGGGEVVVDHRGGTYVLFFTYRGILDRFSGFVYSPTDTPPATDQFLGDGIEVERVAPHWFWYAS